MSGSQVNNKATTSDAAGTTNMLCFGDKSIYMKIQYIQIQLI